MKKILVSGGVKRRKNGTFKRTRKKWKFSKWNEGYIRKKILVSGKKYESFWVYRPDYPKSTNLGYARRSHIVWWIKTGEIVPNNFVLHHKDKNSLNDRFKNLKLMKHGKHSRIHAKRKKVKCYCFHCKEKFYLSQWRINQGRGKFCSQLCFQESRQK